MKRVEIKSKFRLGERVLFSPKDASKEPYKTNAGKVGKIEEILQQGDRIFYLVKFGKGVWDEACIPEDTNELQPIQRKEVSRNER